MLTIYNVAIIFIRSYCFGDRDPQEKSSRFTRKNLTFIFFFKHKIEHTNEQVVSFPTSKGNQMYILFGKETAARVLLFSAINGVLLFGRPFYIVKSTLFKT